MNLTQRERETRTIGEQVGTMVFHFYQIEDPMRKLEIFIEIISFITASLIDEDQKGFYKVK